jgi:hypothetical protein
MSGPVKWILVGFPPGVVQETVEPGNVSKEICIPISKLFLEIFHPLLESVH